MGVQVANTVRHVTNRVRRSIGESYIAFRRAFGRPGAQRIPWRWRRRQGVGEYDAPRVPQGRSGGARVGPNAPEAWLLYG